MKTIILALTLLLFPIGAQAEQAVAVTGPEVPLSWVANPEPDIMAYGLYQAIGNVDSPYFLVAQVSGLAYRAPIQWGEVLYFKLDAVDFIGNRSGLSNASMAAIRDHTGAPGIPAAPIAQGSTVEFVRVNGYSYTVTEPVTP